MTVAGSGYSRFQAAAPRALAPAVARRTTFLKWLRKMHGWIGLWGAALGLLFGTSGILLNHRDVLKIPAVQKQESTIQLPLPSPRRSDPRSAPRPT